MQTKGIYTTEKRWEIIQQSLEERKDWLCGTIKSYKKQAKPMHIIKELEDEEVEITAILSLVCHTLGMFD